MPDPYSKDRLVPVVAEARNWADLMRRLGLRPSGGQRRVLQERVARHGLDTSHFVQRSPWRKYPDAAIADAAVMRGLGMEVDDTNHRRVRRAAARLGLDTSHFTRRAWGQPERPAPPPIAHRVLVALPDHAGRTNRTKLHRALSEIGLPYVCAGCGSTGEWLGRPITLQIDHINGNWRDNRRENLRYLCPNCHAMTSAWCRGGRTGPRTRAS